MILHDVGSDRKKCETKNNNRLLTVYHGVQNERAISIAAHSVWLVFMISAHDGDHRWKSR